MASRQKTMPEALDLINRAMGHYEIIGMGDESEIARWDNEGCVWHLVGVGEPIEDADVTVTTGPLEMSSCRGG